MPTEIRPLAQGDQPDWHRLSTAYLAYYETFVPDPVYASTFVRLVGNDARDFNGLIALRNGQPVGIAHYLLHRHCRKVEDVCYLQDLYVAPEARGADIGRALIEGV